MSQPKKAFNEVRAILGKLDRSREELRQKPTGPQGAAPPAPVPPVPHPGLIPGSQTVGTSRPVAAPMPTVGPAKPQVLPPTPGSRFGRAQPIRPSSENSLGRWNAPGQ